MAIAGLDPLFIRVPHLCAAHMRKPEVHNTVLVRGSVVPVQAIMSLISAVGEGFHLPGLISISVCSGLVDSGGCTTGAVIDRWLDVGGDHPAPSVIGEAFLTRLSTALS
jgi:hypothetical protein